MAGLRERATQELVSSVENGDLGLVTDALARGGDPQVGGTRCLVSEAAERGHHHLLSCLLETGLSPEGSGTNPWTPLMLAAREGHKGTVEALLGLRANPQARDRDGRSALHYAAERGHVECVETLVGVTLQPQQGKVATTPLHLASSGGHLSVVKVLQNAGWALNTRNSDGQTALHCAALGGSIEMMKHLVDAGLDTLEKDHRGHTPMDLELVRAVENGDFVMVNDALICGGDPQVRGSRCLVSEAARRGHHNLLPCLVRAGLSPEGSGTVPLTPLMLAAREGHKDTVQELRALGANPQERDSDGSQP